MSNKNNSRRKFLNGLALGVAYIASGCKSIPEEKSGNCQVTPVQELGPYPPMKFRDQPDHDVDLTKMVGQDGDAAGLKIVVYGKVANLNCDPLKSAVVEIWSANHFGKYRHEFDKHEHDDPNFQGWGQAITNERGEYSFTTILPGEYDSRTRHIHFKISKRGFHEVITQLYFEGEERNKTDGVLMVLTHEEQLQVIHPLVDKGDRKKIEFNIVLEKVLDALPEKVLKEYTGDYQLQIAGTNFEKFTEQVVGGPYKDLSIKLENTGSQIFMSLPFYPKTEIFFMEKDQFQAWAFYNSYMKFNRDGAGKIVSLDLYYNNSAEVIKGMKS